LTQEGLDSLVADLTIRLLQESDSIEALTELIHRAYGRLGAAGFNYTAVDQPPEVTRRRIARGECWVAERQFRIVGTLMLRGPMQNGNVPWYGRPDVAILNQFAVEPAEQGQGIGLRLLQHLEHRAMELGAAELALDTAEGADWLVAWYQNMGYRFIDYAQWEGKTYRSVIMSKTLRMVYS
jgi:GNAT superfamily N-acetyltransferase